MRSLLAPRYPANLQPGDHVIVMHPSAPGRFGVIDADGRVRWDPRFAWLRAELAKRLISR